MQDQNTNNSTNLNKNNSPVKINIELNKSQYLFKNLPNINNNNQLDITKPSTGQNYYQNSDKIPEAEIINKVCTANLNCKLNFESIIKKLKEAKYNDKEKYIEVKKIINKENITFLIYETGKIIFSGSKTEENSKKAIIKLAKEIREPLYKNRKIRFKIEKFIWVYESKIQIDLNELTEIIKDDCNGELKLLSELLIYHMNEPKITLLITKNGKVIFQSDKEKEKEKINQALKIIYPLLVKYKDKYSVKEFNNMFESKKIYS